MTTPVKFPVAKLLKEKGFDKPIKNYYRITGSGVFNTIKPINHNNDILQKTAGGMTYVSAPDIGEVVMWLYEKYGIWVYSYSVAPYLLDEEDYPKIVFVSKVQKFKEFDIFVDTDNGLAVNHYSSPTEAYEAAIGYCLTNLI